MHVEGTTPRERLLAALHTLAGFAVDDTLTVGGWKHSLVSLMRAGLHARHTSIRIHDALRRGASEMMVAFGTRYQDENKVRLYRDSRLSVCERHGVDPSDHHAVLQLEETMPQTAAEAEGQRAALAVPLPVLDDARAALNAGGAAGLDAEGHNATTIGADLIAYRRLVDDFANGLTEPRLPPLDMPERVLELAARLRRAADLLTHAPAQPTTPAKAREAGSTLAIPRDVAHAASARLQQVRLEATEGMMSAPGRYPDPPEVLSGTRLREALRDYSHLGLILERLLDLRDAEPMADGILDRDPQDEGARSIKRDVAEFEALHLLARFSFVPYLMRTAVAHGLDPSAFTLCDEHLTRESRAKALALADHLAIVADEGVAGDNAAASRNTTKPVGEGKRFEDVQARLLEMRSQGEPYTNGRDLALKLECSEGTVRNAIKKSTTLKAWRAQHMKPKAAPKATGLDAAYRESARQTTEPSPDDVLLDDERDAALAQLRDKGPETRAWINAMSEEEKSKAARLWIEQQADDRTVRQHTLA